jgi:3D (Asp-Asp-Asp) domain-containing protein
VLIRLRPRMLLALIALAAITGTMSLGLPSAVQADDAFAGIGFGVVSAVVWERHVHIPIRRKTVYRLDLSQRADRIASVGSDGIRVVVIRFERIGNGPIRHRVVKRYVERAARPRIVALGLGPIASYLNLNRRALAKLGMIARLKVDMIATAYTPYCSGCDGVTATGLRAGPGIVAVDPRVIPLGTHLYIPGYGFALAGDTGGDIRGDRVDLGFSSYSEALRFGRKAVTVYVLG